MLLLIAELSFGANRVVRDVSYGADPQQRFDVYAPPHAHAAPVILMVHGGGWTRGDKAIARMYENKVAHWLPKGFVFISANYRLDVSAIEQAKDISRALTVAQQRASEWGGDPKQFVLMGHSAGAHLVALVAVTNPRIIGTVVLDSGALDVVRIMESRHLPMYDRAFGSEPAEWRAASPYHVLAKKTAPMLVVCSSRRLVSCTQARAFVNKLTKLGTRASVLEENLSHRQINEGLGKPSAYTKAVDAFLQSLRP